MSVKTKKLRGKGIVRGGAVTAPRAVGLLGGILTYAVEAGFISINPAHGLRNPKDDLRTRRLIEAEYRTLGEMLRTAKKEVEAVPAEVKLGVTIDNPLLGEEPLMRNMSFTSIDS